jgi:hypothetical protein
MLRNLQLALKANVAYLQSNLGNGLLGLLALTISTTIYNTLSDVAFLHTPNPGPTAIIEEGLTAAQITSVRQLHTEATGLFLEYTATDKALKQQLIGAINSLYLRTLNHRITGFANRTTRQMLAYTNYGRLSPSDV